MSVPTPLTTDSLAAEMDTYPIAPEALIWVGSKTVRPGWWLVVLRLGAQRVRDVLKLGLQTGEVLVRDRVSDGPGEVVSRGGVGTGDLLDG